MGEVSHINGVMASDGCWVGQDHVEDIVAVKTCSSATIMF